MFARKCDRCGSFYIPKDDVRKYTVNTCKSLIIASASELSSVMPIDLCASCYDDLVTFMACPDVMHVYLKHKREEELNDLNM